MKFKHLYVVVICLLLVTSVTNAQEDELFGNLSVGKSFAGSGNWGYSSALTYKHIFDEIGWRRLSGDFGTNYKYGVWGFKGGLSLQYTFDDEIVNSLEVRPWVGASLRNELINHLAMIQVGRLEWRNFFYDGVDNEAYIRTTFDVGFEYELHDLNLETWAVETGYTWYFLKDPAIGERYANSREFRFLFIKKLPKAKLIFGYKAEKFREFDGEDHGAAHTIHLAVAL
ncbi:hypothetical protein Y10_30830 [Neptunitalea sp. Y10]|uniref:DUF481 domain-containing protein n=2 Tax=Neptunitalea lumnitzerae TaxID=2965509 RepID=A0ABQ5MMS6_9FLAO|nr:hypothetical protein Y10_30830 [Neptunitalea sp. Y10]